MAQGSRSRCALARVYVQKQDRRRQKSQVTETEELSQILHTKVILWGKKLEGRIFITCRGYSPSPYLVAGINKVVGELLQLNGV